MLQAHIALAKGPGLEYHWSMILLQREYPSYFSFLRILYGAKNPLLYRTSGLQRQLSRFQGGKYERHYARQGGAMYRTIGMENGNETKHNICSK